VINVDIKNSMEARNLLKFIFLSFGQNTPTTFSGVREAQTIDGCGDIPFYTVWNFSNDTTLSYPCLRLIQDGGAPIQYASNQVDSYKLLLNLAFSIFPTVCQWILKTDGVEQLELESLYETPNLYNLLIEGNTIITRACQLPNWQYTGCAPLLCAYLDSSKSLQQITNIDVEKQLVSLNLTSTSFSRKELLGDIRKHVDSEANAYGQSYIQINSSKFNDFYLKVYNATPIIPLVKRGPRSTKPQDTDTKKDAHIAEM
jgi:hypothetical protein